MSKPIDFYNLAYQYGFDKDGILIYDHKIFLCFPDVTMNFPVHPVLCYVAHIERIEKQKTIAEVCKILDCNPRKLKAMLDAFANFCERESKNWFNTVRLKWYRQYRYKIGYHDFKAFEIKFMKDLGISIISRERSITTDKKVKGLRFDTGGYLGESIGLIKWDHEGMADLFFKELDHSLEMKQLVKKYYRLG